MATNYIYKNLKADIKSCVLEKHLLQGSTNRTFKFTLIDRDEKVLFTSSPEITMTVLYNPRMVDNRFVYDGSYVLSKTDSKYAITVVEEGTTLKYSSIEVPFIEEMVTYAGLCEIVLQIVDGSSTTYTYGLFYTVDRNDAYFPSSIPNNLPDYKALDKKITDLNSKVVLNTSSISANTASIVTKAEKDLSNVGDFPSIPDNTLLVKTGGKLKDSGIKLIGDDINAPTKTLTVKEVNTAPNTINIGANVSLSENGGFLEYHTNSLDKYYLLLDYENDATTGSKLPIYWRRDAKERQIIQPDDSQTMNDVKRVDFGKPSYDRQIQCMYVDAISPVSNVTIRIIVNNKPIAYHPSKNAWDGLESGYNFNAGVNKITIDPFFSNLVEYNTIFEFKADSAINLKGNGTIPYYELDLNRITRSAVALTEDIPVVPPNNPADIRDKLQTLIGDDRLDASAIKNIPTGGGTGNYLQVDLSNANDTAWTNKNKNLNFAQNDLADIDLDKLNEKVNATDFGKQVTLNSTAIGTKLNTDMTNVNINALSNTIKTTTAYSELPTKSQVDDNTSEINRLKTNISTSLLPVYTYRGRGLPTLPSDIHKAYYLNIIVLRAGYNAIDLPSNAPTGTIFSLENNDRTQTIVLRPSSSDTINGSNTSYQASADTLSFFVKKDNDWVLAYGGVFPNNLSSLRSTIQALLPNELNTVSEISAQLKDRLHTFREIQTEFGSQLHTAEQIDAIVGAKGYVKEGGRIGMQSDQAVPTNENWVLSDFKSNMEIVLPAQNKGMQYILIALPTTTSAIVSDIVINGQTIEFDSHDYNINEFDYKIFISNTKLDSDSNVRVKLNYDISSMYGSGITFDDGTNNVADVTKVNVYGARVSLSSGEQNAIDLDAGVTFVDQDKNEFYGNLIKSTDRSIRISNQGKDSLGRTVVDITKGVTGENEGIHAMLGNDEIINSKFGKSRLYFSDLKVSGGGFVYRDMKDKSFVIQDVDPQDDPNVSGGTTFFVGIYYEPNPDLENTVTQDGSIELELVDDSDQPLNDMNGNPMGVKIDYKAGDKLKPMLYNGEVQVKAYTKVHMKLSLDFPNEELISVGSNTQICLQSTTKDSSGGYALNSFMLYTGYRFSINSRYYGFNNLNLARTLIFPEPETDVKIGTWDIGDNTYIDFRTAMKMQINENKLILSDDGSTMPVWSLGKLYDKVDSFFISGKNYKATIKSINPQGAMNLSLLEYGGTGIPTKPILERYDNGSPVFTNDWTVVDTLFIPEMADGSEQIQKKNFLIPDNSKGIAILLYSQSSQIPLDVKISDLEGDISPWFNRIIVSNNSHINEKLLLSLKENYSAVVYTPNGDVSYRYTANSTDTKVPAGVINVGNKMIVNDNAWSDAGSFDPNKTQGDYKFLASGHVNMRYRARVFNEQQDISEVTFWLAKVNGDGTFTEVPNSKVSTTIEGNRKTKKYVNSVGIVGNKPDGWFEFNVKENDSYRMFMKSDKDDGFYLQSELDGDPLFKADFIFDEVSASEFDILSRLNNLENSANEITFIENGKEVYDKILEYDVSTGKMKVVDKK